MLISVHGAVGALIGENINSSLWAFLLAFISHFALDLIPHGDQHQVEYYKSKKRLNKIANLLATDSVVALIFFALYFDARQPLPITPSIIWGVVGGILPDLLVAIYNLNRRFFFRFNYIHHRIHQTFKLHIPFTIAFIIQIGFLFLLWQLYQR